MFLSLFEIKYHIRNLLGVDKGWTDIGAINKHKYKLTIYKKSMKNSMCEVHRFHRINDLGELLSDLV